MPRIFDNPGNGFASAPFGPRQLSQRQRELLFSMLPILQRAMNQNLVFKLNAGKNIGNFNLAKCRHVTVIADKSWLDALGLEHLWEDIELEHTLVVRMSFRDEESERA